MIPIIQEAVKDRSRKPADAVAPKQSELNVANKKHYPTVSLLLVLGLVGWAIAFSLLFKEGLFVKELTTAATLLFFSVLFQQFGGAADR